MPEHCDQHLHSQFRPCINGLTTYDYLRGAWRQAPLNRGEMVATRVLELPAREEENTNGSAGGDHDHRPVQHRDGKPPWCKVCGLTTEGLEPVSRLSGRPPSEESPK